GGTLGLDDLTPAGLFAASHIAASGAASVSADVAAAAVLPGMDEPFDLGTASLSVSWTNIANPLDANVSLTGGITDLIGARVEQLVEILDKVKALTEQFSEYVPDDLKQGLDSVISVVKTFDETIVPILKGGPTDLSLQDRVTA